MFSHINRENAPVHAPHTPAGKMFPQTPFKVPLNDENTASQHPKMGGVKRNLFTSNDPSQFITPIGCYPFSPTTSNL